MSDQGIAATGTEAENTVPESSEHEAGVVTPETEQEPTSQESEKAERDKALARMERRINKKHAEAAEARAEAAFYRSKLEQQQQPNQQPTEKLPVDPAEIERAVQTRAQQLVETNKFVEQCNTVASKGLKQFSDFNDSLSALQSELPLVGRDGQTPTPALKTILEADNPAAMINYLAKNPDVAAELVALSPTQLARRLDRIEREDIKPTRQTSSAPKPLDPEKSAATRSMPDPETNPAAWREWRNKNASR